MKQAKEKKIELTEGQKQAIAVVVRNDLNFEKNPSIFFPARNRVKVEERTIEWKMTLENGDKISSSIDINPSRKCGNLDTEDQKVLYALIKLWDEKERPEVLQFSLQELAKKLGKVWSLRTHKSLKQSLLRLSTTTFVWFNSYCDGITKKYLNELRAFTILVDLHIAEVGEGESPSRKQSCSVKFNSYLDGNLRSKHTQPTFYNQILKFKSGIAQLIYQLLELVMYDKTYYERNSGGLFFEDLHLDAVDYHYPSGRKRILEIAIKELNGVPISTGIIYVSLAQTVDKRDWKIVVKKIEQMLLSLKYEESEKKEVETNQTTSEEALKPSKLVDPAEQIVRSFLEKFRIKRKDPLKKELLTAQEWIEEYKLDLEKAQVFISKCKVWAAETDFDVQNFAGLRQYLDRTTQIFEQIEVERAIRACGLCDSSGRIDATEANGREFSFKCVHDLEQIQIYANKYKVQVRLYGLTKG